MFMKKPCGCSYDKPCTCGCNKPMECGMAPQMGYGMAPGMGYGMSAQCPIIEPVNTTCIEKDFCCEVPHICPIHTHTVNRVHYIHTYTPEYSCSESTEFINNDCGSCCQFNRY